MKYARSIGGECLAGRSGAGATPRIMASLFDVAAVLICARTLRLRLSRKIFSGSKSSAWRLSYPSPSMARYEIPKQLPEFVECGDVFVPSNEATLEEWQRHKNPDTSVNQILKLAEKLALPDNIPLLPRLRALARANVLAFNRKF